MPLTTEVAAVVTEELERAFYRAGKRLLTMYLTDLTTAEVARVTHDPAALTAAIELALGNPGQQPTPGQVSHAQRLLAVRSYPVQRTRDLLDCLEEVVRKQPTLEGMTLPAACTAIKQAINHTITPGSLRTLLMRNAEHHCLAVKRQRVGLRSDIIVEVLGQRHAARQAAEQARAAAEAADVDMRAAVQ